MGTRRSALYRDVGAQSDEFGGRWGLSQRDFLTEWRGDKKIRNVAEMLANSAVISALRLSLEMPIRGIDWSFSGPEGIDAENDPGLTLLNDSFNALTGSWQDHTLDALLMPFYGWSLFSITYQREGGRVLWRKFKPLGHDTIQGWIFDDDGGLAGVKQWPHLWPEPIPIERLILYRFRKTSGDPEGESVLRPAWISWYHVKNVMTLEGIGIERNLAGLPVITPPMGADMADGSTDRTAAETLGRNVRNDEQGSVVLPAPTGEGDHMRWHFQLVSAPGVSKVLDTNMVISRYEKRMLMAALSQFLMLGMDNIGALATFEGATDFHAMLLDAIADNIAETFTKYAIPRLFALNGLDPDGYTLEHTSAGNKDLLALGDLLQKAGGFINIMPDDELEIRSWLNFPPKTLEEIQMARDDAEAQRAARIAAMPPQMQQQMGAEVYAAGNAPDDDDRRRFERTWERKMGAYWREQQKRILDEM